jgi:hypothetical protein
MQACSTTPVYPFVPLCAAGPQAQAQAAQARAPGGLLASMSVATPAPAVMSVCSGFRLTFDPSALQASSGGPTETGLDMLGAAAAVAAGPSAPPPAGPGLPPALAAEAGVPEGLTLREQMMFLAGENRGLKQGQAALAPAIQQAQQGTQQVRGGKDLAWAD